ncbi:cation efflux family-domain-containing protein [Fomitopsis serialis]|uniref:cation efflux family-domain-containing protein n=1 Tax=Fomitopsis serialis TaxID=139415 RepID=UPI00200769A2|nr:cation efflux family-domain-containing protein [Neoantrodia serialis]KAH9910632.1 cation efflux family-domain-containing protein [Neoantrodia serialis]
MTSRRPHSSQAKGKEPATPTAHEPEHGPSSHSHSHTHSHEHSASFFGGMSHTHGPGEDGHGHDAEQIVEALQKGAADRGSRITLIGLFANVGLTASKGLAGWYMNSASLLADAGHSLSDLLGDFVTLATWKVSRKPPSERYPYGFGKFEVLGSVTVSLLLTGGALGIGYHSLTLLLEALSHAAGPVHDVASTVAQTLPAAGAHGHGHGHALDPNAAWFALASVLGKEWLYRATKRVADDERSPVLHANALHHRSDVYGSGVALLAILGTWWFPHLPLDPIGGILVSILIVRQSWGILAGGFHQLTDGGVSAGTRHSLVESLTPILPSTASSLTPSATQIQTHTEDLLGIRDVRAMRAGGLMFVDLVAEVPRTLSVEETSRLEAQIMRSLKGARREVTEVRVRFHPVDQEEIVSRHGHVHDHNHDHEH